MSARDLHEDDFAIFTEADETMLNLAATAGADELDYSEFYIEDHPHHFPDGWADFLSRGHEVQHPDLVMPWLDQFRDDS